MHEAPQEDYEQNFCYPVKKIQRPLMFHQLHNPDGQFDSKRQGDFVDQMEPKYKGLMKHPFDPDFAEQTVVTPEIMRRREIAFLVIYQFAKYVSAWLTRTARRLNLARDLFLKHAEELKSEIIREQTNDGDDGESFSTMNLVTQMDFLEQSEILEPRNRETRNEVYR